MYGKMRIVKPKIDVYLKSVQSSLVDLYIQEWYGVIHVQEQLCTYRLFKDVFQHELYLSNLIPKFRVALSRLRLSSHTLGIELGRYPPRVPTCSHI